MGTILSFIGGLTAAAATFLGVKIKTASQNEAVYAQHIKELFVRLDKTTQERDDLQRQVIKLQSQVNEQSRQIKELREQISNLTVALKQKGDI